jgi:hypothetical protein
VLGLCIYFLYSRKRSPLYRYQELTAK